MSLLVPTAFYSKDRYLIVSFAVVIVLAVLFRVYIYRYPASMIGLDPDGYAFWVQGVIKTGSINAVRDSFYSQAPLFEILPASVGIIAGVDAPTAMAVYPALIGVIFPLTAFLIVRNLVSDPWSKVAIVGATIAGFSKISTVLSYQPIAQTLGVLQWCPVLILLMIYIKSRDSRALAMVFLLFISSIFTHKLPPTLIVALSFVFGALLLADTGIRRLSWTLPKYRTGQNAVYPMIITTLILSLILYIQYFHVGGLGLRMINRLIFVFQPGSDAALYTPSTSYQHAIQVQNTLTSLLLRRGHGFVLLPLGGIAGLLLLLDDRRKETIFVFSVIAVTNLLIIGSLIDPSIGGVDRSLYMAEPVLAALASVCFLRTLPALVGSRQKRLLLNSVGVILVGVIIVAQIASVTVALPDNSTNYRTYLTSSELTGKRFANEYVSGDVSTDSYYASEATRRSISQHRKYEYDHLRPEFVFNSNMSALNDRYILFRPGVKLYRSPNGIYRITWDPSSKLAQKFNTIHSTGYSTMYEAEEKRA
ncbi:MULTISPECIES: hypothetical protein [unclassified Haladaptatus]|uniref:hypothetical protein n=1 Tax=unclassified Haladaptatus TaxID=2622732 RepID=UPI00209C1B2C|nr:MULTISPECIES: hypothetical protein [unclassified Haladaptatus]MCO8244776.1 hypothetical protein [Haladaptatus sp. AB643]MCO8255712.1 hypothetical protein [Haladaptatus sp. AB618]